jgi:hypothetical protein
MATPARNIAGSAGTEEVDCISRLYSFDWRAQLEPTVHEIPDALVLRSEVFSYEADSLDHDDSEVSGIVLSGGVQWT